MGFTIKEKAFLLHYFRKRVKQESEDWPYFVPPYTEEFQARQTSEPDANHNPSLRRSQVSP
jgi:hypothetical protein